MRQILSSLTVLALLFCQSAFAQITAIPVGNDIDPLYSFQGEDIGLNEFDEFGKILACQGGRMVASIPAGDSYNGIVALHSYPSTIADEIYYPAAGSTVNFGHSIAFAGDISSFPGPNLLIGAPYGSANGDISIFSAFSPYSHQFTLSPTQGTGEELGSVVHSLGDILKYDSGPGDYIFGTDGSDEILYSAPYYNSGTTNGRIAIHDLENDQTALNITGIGDAKLGTSLAVINDLNGDNRPEIAAGAPGAASGKGEIKIFSPYIVSGVVTYSTLATINTISGAPFDFSAYSVGYGVADAGDVNSDGYHDILVSLNDNGTLREKVLLVSGKDLDTSPSVLCEITAPELVDNSFGDTLVSLKDVNGVPGDEFAIGAPTCSTGSLQNNGCLHIYTYAQIQPSVWGCRRMETVAGSLDDYNLGISAVSCDFDGDGTPDLAIGTKRDGPASQQDAGSVVTYLGQSGDQCPSDPNKTTPGECGCGIPDTDSDSDGYADCLGTDYCPDDPNKTEPGICGCGIADIDYDSDGYVDCNETDQCPDDPNKTSPGICGCGLPDEDLDNDGEFDCFDTSDYCPDDPNKIYPGVCGCGIADIDYDYDGFIDCNENDQCPDDPNKTTPGTCGCGIPDTDINNDGDFDCFDTLDFCPDDPYKKRPGVCGCNVPDKDTNNDGIIDCNVGDACPDDPNKFSPGICGCNIPDEDLDNDGEFDCFDTTDFCPDDPNKIYPGVCGCNIPDTDSDGNSIPDCNNNDTCPDDSLKLNPGICGCKLPDVDIDGDGLIDCFELSDACPDDPIKTKPGICGCGFIDEDLNSDDIIDCNIFDHCPYDSLKSTPGVCGCFTPDQDKDSNGIVDCLEWDDACPDDPNKTKPGVCGCNFPDKDLDKDGEVDCNDNNHCPDDSLKATPGICGCGIPDEDWDNNGIVDCLEWDDACPDDPNKKEPGICGCLIPDEDLNNDGLIDCNGEDFCPDDPDKTTPGICGCGIPDKNGDATSEIDCLEDDLCPGDLEKSMPGICGCGIPDEDKDNDGVLDCVDGEDFCPNDPDKTIPGTCGCGVPDTDTDGDSTPDCFDDCPEHEDKGTVNVCGCGIPVDDTNNDGIADCLQDLDLKDLPEVEPPTPEDKNIKLEDAKTTKKQNVTLGFDEAKIDEDKFDKKKGDFFLRRRVFFTYRKDDNANSLETLPISSSGKKKKVVKKVTTRKNNVTFRKLKVGKYKVRYRLEIVRRKKVRKNGKRTTSTRVVSKSSYSDTKTFTITK